ncbi:hypothetical protein BpHYR1_020914 [Brachionus plicatilis]|uniref:Uncharacterized protein n=1 Tax=Brachionus plicatilis TaxID=10195 RepID=A0A3M7REC2_BRAPC|nr:hypothetical protein BpHYR1_020914 [Brachionus plicatilis]
MYSYDILDLKLNYISNFFFCLSLKEFGFLIKQNNSTFNMTMIYSKVISCFIGYSSYFLLKERKL